VSRPGEIAANGLPIKARPVTFSAYNGRPMSGWIGSTRTRLVRLPECRGILLKMSETNLPAEHTMRRTCSLPWRPGLPWVARFAGCAKHLRYCRGRTVVSLWRKSTDDLINDRKQPTSTPSRRRCVPAGRSVLIAWAYKGLDLHPYGSDGRKVKLLY